MYPLLCNQRLLKRLSLKVLSTPLYPTTRLFVKVDTEVYFAILAPF